MPGGSGLTICFAIEPIVHHQIDSLGLERTGRVFPYR